MLLERSAGNRWPRKPAAFGWAESASLAKPRPRALPRLLGLDLAVARRGVGLQRSQQAPRTVGHFGNRAVERLGVGLRRRIEAGEFSHELQRGSMDFGVRGRRIEIEQGLDVAAHCSLLCTLRRSRTNDRCKIRRRGLFCHESRGAFTLSAPANSEFPMTHVTYK